MGLALRATLIVSFAVMFIGKYSPLKFFQAIRPAILVAFSTSSSNATLPVTMECAEQGLKIPKSITSFVLPLGAAINLDGTAVYQSVSAVFIAQVFGLELTLAQMIIIVATAVIASIGAAGVPSSAVITLAIVLQAVGLPIEGIGLVLGIERILDMIRTTVNIIGDSSATVVINRTEKNNLAA